VEETPLFFRPYRSSDSADVVNLEVMHFSLAFSVASEASSAFYQLVETNNSNLPLFIR
jgi:hypothetical protein